VSPVTDPLAACAPPFSPGAPGGNCETGGDTPPSIPGVPPGGPPSGLGVLVFALQPAFPVGGAKWLTSADGFTFVPFPSITRAGLIGTGGAGISRFSTAQISGTFYFLTKGDTDSAAPQLVSYNDADGEVVRVAAFPGALAATLAGGTVVRTGELYLIIRIANTDNQVYSFTPAGSVLTPYGDPRSEAPVDVRGSSLAWFGDLLYMALHGTTVLTAAWVYRWLIDTAPAPPPQWQKFYERGDLGNLGELFYSPSADALFYAVANIPPSVAVSLILTFPFQIPQPFGALQISANANLFTDGGGSDPTNGFFGRFIEFNGQLFVQYSDPQTNKVLRFTGAGWVTDVNLKVTFGVPTGGGLGTPVVWNNQLFVSVIPGAATTSIIVARDAAGTWTVRHTGIGLQGPAGVIGGP